MNPMLQEALLSILRWTLNLVAGILVEHGIWTDGDAHLYVVAASMAVLSLGWSLWTRYHGRIKMLTAAAWPWPMTEHELDAEIKAGNTAPASTPKDTIPAITPTPH